MSLHVILVPSPSISHPHLFWFPCHHFLSLHALIPLPSLSNSKSITPWPLVCCSVMSGLGLDVPRDGGVKVKSYKVMSKSPRV